MTGNSNRAKLIKGYVDRIKPGPKDEFHWDTGVKGFGVRVTPKGKITFVVQGRIGSAKEARITIGPYGVFTVDQARDEAREHLRSMRRGIDPRDLRRRSEMDRHVEQVFAAWKDKPIASITPADCRKRYEEMAMKGLRGKGPAPALAGIAMTTLRTLVNFAADEYKRLDGAPIIEHNPVAIFRKDLKPSAPRTRQIDRRKVGEFWYRVSEARTATLWRASTL